MKLSIVLLAVSTASAPLRAPAQTTWFVDANAAAPGSGTRAAPYSSIQYALSRPTTVDGDTVLVRPGTYPELVDFLGKDVVLASTMGPGVTTIDATLQFSLEQSAVKLRSGEGPSCTLSGFTIQGGAGSQIVEPVSGSTLFAGGGILAIGSSATVRDCIIVGNHSDIGGGVYAESAGLTLERCKIEGNESFFFGAGLHFRESHGKVSGVTIRNNTSINNDGGGINVFGGRLVVEGGLLDGNTTGNCGANVAADMRANLTLSGVTVRRGFTLDGNGGGLWANSSAVVIERCTFAQNNAGDAVSNREGGGLYVSNGTLEITSSHFRGNTSARGGAVLLSSSTATIRSSLFTGNAIRSGLNYTLTEGGALAVRQSTTRIIGCGFRDNSATSDAPSIFGPIARGGAIWCDTRLLEIRRCVFRGNHAFYDGPPDPAFQKPEPGAQGGAVFGPARVRVSRFLSNRAISRPVAHGRAEGGAIFGASHASHCSFGANEVRGSGSVPDSGPAAEAATLECCTFEDNLPLTLPPLGPNCFELPCN